MINPHDFKGLFFHAVHRDMGRARKENLARSRFAPRASAPRPLFQVGDGGIDTVSAWLARDSFGGVFEIIANALQVRCCCWRPAYTHLGAEHLFQAGVHLFFFNELAAVGLRDTFPYGCAKPDFLFKQVQSCVFHLSYRVGPSVGGDLH